MSSLDFNFLLGMFLFCLGLSGFLFRQNGLIALMCLEIILNGINIILVQLMRIQTSPEAGSLYLFIVLVAAAEAAIGLSLFVCIYRKINSVKLDKLTNLGR